jgi:predicted SAM-dependent methyltransferase
MSGMARRLKQAVGRTLIPGLPISRHVFDHVRLELNAMRARILLHLPPMRRRIKKLQNRRDIKANIGCGPFGLAGWANFDLFPSHGNDTIACDCRKEIPLPDVSCIGIHVEHFFEHLAPEERYTFLAECKRCLAANGVLRIVVPDAQLYIKAYLEPGWSSLNAITCGGDVPEEMFRTKMEVLNHVFLQGSEHYGGYDAETLSLVLVTAGLRPARASWRQGAFPGGCIDRELHRSYSLYFEAQK